MKTTQYFEQAAKAYQKKLKLNGIHETLVSVFDVNLLQGSIETPLVVSKKNGLKVKAQRIECISTCPRMQSCITI
jgi:hypothetical protein